MTHHRPYLIDTTLRDGEQKAGFAIRESDKPTIATMLDSFGVDEIEIGIPAMGDMIRRTISIIGDLPLSCRRTVWCRARALDIELAASCHHDAVHISLPASDRLRELAGMSPRKLFRLADDMIGLARLKFGFVSVGVQDASRTDNGMLREIAVVCREAGANRLRLADTVGIWTPSRTGECISGLVDHTRGMELAIHAHNDLGMATANTLAALDNGAVAADVTILGIGERAGNAALEQVVTAGRMTGGYFGHVTLPRVKELCRTFAEMTGLAVQDNQPVVGDGVVRHESGIHVHALLRDADSYQPFRPEQVGHDGAEFVLGKHSGLAALRHIMQHSGIGLADEHNVSHLLERLREYIDSGDGKTDANSARTASAGG